MERITERDAAGPSWSMFNRDEDSGEETEVIEMMSSDDEDDSNSTGINYRREFLPIPKADVVGGDTVQGINPNPANQVLGGSCNGNGVPITNQVQPQPGHSQDQVLQITNVTKGDMVAQLLYVLRSPSPAADLQKVSKIPSNPQTLTDFEKQKQLQRQQVALHSAPQQGGSGASIVNVPVPGLGGSSGSSRNVQEPGSAREARRATIIRCIQRLAHACQCKEPNCLPPSCQKLKRVIAHAKVCKRKLSDGSQCLVCKQLIVLCCYHAKICQVVSCSVPFCGTIKQKIRINRAQRLRQIASN